MLKILQAGRALAAISVAAYHLSTMMGYDRYGGDAVFYEYTKLGGLGVDFFFVLSGFIILLAHINDIGKPEAWRTYIYRRFIRLFPIYWLYTALFILLLLLGTGTTAKIPESFGDWATALSLIRFTEVSPPITVAWTLFHEMAFYAVFSILILNYRIGLVTLGIFMLLPVVYFNYPIASERTAFNVYTSAYNLHFLFGMGAMLIYRLGGRGMVELTIGISLTIFSLATMPLPHESSKLLLTAGFALILAGAAKLEVSGVLRTPDFLGLIGDASYTIYLVHIPLQIMLIKIAMRLHLHQIIGSSATYIVILVGAIALGCLVYLIIERRLLKLLRKKKEQKLIIG